MGRHVVDVTVVGVDAGSVTAVGEALDVVLGYAAGSRAVEGSQRGGVVDVAPEHPWVGDLDAQEVEDFASRVARAVMSVSGSVQVHVRAIPIIESSAKPCLISRGDVLGEHEERSTPREGVAERRDAVGSERRLLAACRIALDGLGRMTTDDFSKGGDRSVRRVLEEAIAESEEEGRRKRLVAFLRTASQALDGDLRGEAVSLLGELGEGV